MNFFSHQSSVDRVTRLCLPARRRRRPTVATWLIVPVVICLSQRLSHACLSTNLYTVKLRSTKVGGGDAHKLSAQILLFICNKKLFRELGFCVINLIIY